MRKRWRLPLLALAGLAATALFIAHDAQVASAHSVQGDTDGWSVDDVDGVATWTGHAHTDWRQNDSSDLPIDPWTGSPGATPCDDPAAHGLDENVVRTHCAYVIKHSNPWRIIKEGHPAYHETWFSDCAVLGGSEGSNADRLRGPVNVDNMRFYRAGAATCTDGTHSPDAQGGSLHAPDAPGSPDQPGGHDRLHGDQDFLDQHPEVNDYPADWPVVALRGQRLPPNLRVIADAHANGRCPNPPGGCDEIQSLGTHTNNGNSVNGADHKTVMFWVWWEHAADDRCTPSTQLPVSQISGRHRRAHAHESLQTRSQPRQPDDQHVTSAVSST